MAKKDDYRQVARMIKRELDDDRLAFKTYNRERFTTALKSVAGTGTHKTGDSIDDEIESAFAAEGLLIFPSMGQVEADGYTRVFRSGTLIASILNAIRFPGGGSDEELANILGSIKRRVNDGLN